ncbi:D-Ala-D-Ala carboxypeptidase family metallohydrolase [Bacillus cereus]|nr:D-Ala-D-Ala carboxypeptidase family metallohydrolase [Bacillus cereus]
MADIQGLKLNEKLKQVYEKALSSGLRFTSGYRQGSTGPSGRPDSHSQGMAMDFAGTKQQMDEFAKWAKTSPLFTEVLWQTAGHYDHVHVGWQEGKHQAGKMYVGDKTLIDRPTGDGGGDLTVGTASPSSDKGFIGSAFTGIVRAVTLIVFLIIAVYFLFQAFPQIKVKL